MSTKSKIAIIVTLALLVALVMGLGPLSNLIARLPDSPNSAAKPSPLISYDVQKVGNAWPELIQASPAPPTGNPNAPYTMIEMGDFQCPNCGKAAPLLEQLIACSKGQVKMYFINYPMPELHSHAEIAAEASMSAASQGKFWPMYHSLYGHQDELIASEITYNAGTIPGFNTGQLGQDLASSKWASAVGQQVSTCNAVGLQSTPTIFLRKGDSGPVSWYAGTGLSLNKGDKQPTHRLVYLMNHTPWPIDAAGRLAITKLIDSELNTPPLQ